ncbi:MAG: ribonuclease III [Actinobacteria bacterium]|uniref:ribonuclease III n=1 Tax=freshwater metagenome TaxID=449393 RepID=A0A6J6NCD2_9ZZZZ|nr:ribonuclease III [Actinomycetota bacterium]
MKLDALSEKLGVEINRELLKLALTHRSYSYEHGNIPNNERLEFLGDSVLGFVVTSHIYETLTYLPEGEMTKVKNAVVSARALAVVAAELSLGEYLLLGKGELATDGRNKPNLLADAFEAILGAAYMSNGFDAARALVEKFVFPLLDNPDEIRANSDPKTTLQERIQALGRGTPNYKTRFEGPDHNRDYFSTLYVNGEEISHGEGRTKKNAETAAAVKALEILVDATPVVKKKRKRR